ncbi:MAG: Tetratricopeptide 2 repeat protein [Candidatus Nomurabacteria bacterium]|nr:Tetratricopeptide 2 repeat protein [Candidatus Nomurabacteria bacterium]
MKLLASFFSRLYRYATICIIVGSPLFFIPRTSFAPEITYYLTMTVLVAVALVSYVISAAITRTWHTVSKLEFYSYIAFSICVIGSVIFSQDQKTTLFGDMFNPMSAVSLLMLPAVMYLVRTLPEALRQRLKYILLVMLGVSSFVFVSALMFTGKIATVGNQLFSGFTTGSALAVYIGIFVIGCLLFVKKVPLAKKYKAAIVVTAIFFLSWAVSLSVQDNIRPDSKSSFIVGKTVMLKEGVFGIGAGHFDRAWQLYRPASVIASPFFIYDFNQGADTMSTLFVNIGILGLVSFLALVLSALYSTYLSYRQVREGKEHLILGMLTMVLLYMAIVAWLIPFSFAMLMVWMVVAGLGIAKARLTEYHPSKKLAFLMIPLAVLLLVNLGVTLNKIKAYALYSKAATSTNPQEVITLLSRASVAYPYDGFYRAQVETGIQANRLIVSTTTLSQDQIQNIYLTNASSSVDAGLNAVKLNGSNYKNYVSLGQAYELAIPFEKDSGYAHAKAAYEEAVKLYPENPYLYVILARLEASAGTKEGVRIQLTEALKKKQNFADALYLMSQLEASDNKITEALNYALEAVKNAPNDPLVYVQAGLLLYGQKDYANAVTALNKALTLDPNNANVAYFLALSLRDGGRPDLAKQIVDQLLTQNPGNADLVALKKTLTPTQAAAPAATPKVPAKK